MTFASPFYQDKNSEGLGTGEDPYIVPRTTEKITIDAVHDETAWEHSFVLKLNFEVDPGENVPPSVQTEVLLTHDDAKLYTAFRCHDPDPSAIQAHLSDRDHLGNDDCVTLVIDCEDLE